jgi:hypothetical protein
MSDSKYRPKRRYDGKPPRWFINLYLRRGLRNQERVQLAQYVRRPDDSLTVFLDTGNCRVSCDWTWC